LIEDRPLVEMLLETLDLNDEDAELLLAMARRLRNKKADQ